MVVMVVHVMAQNGPEWPRINAELLVPKISSTTPKPVSVRATVLPSKGPKSSMTSVSCGDRKILQIHDNE